MSDQDQTSRSIRTLLTICGVVLIVAGAAVAVFAVPSDDQPPAATGAAAGCDPSDFVQRPIQPAQVAPDDDSSGDSGEVLFRGNFESGGFDDDWYLQSLPDRASIISPGAFGSNHGARFEVRDGDVEPDTGSERSEVSGPDVDEGDDLYFRDTFRIPSGSSIGTSWQIVNQLHENDWEGSPGLAVLLDPCPSLRIGAGDGSPTFVEDVPIQYDRWHDLVYRANLSRDPDVGFIEAWLDGTPLQLDNGQTRIYGQTLQTDSAYLKAGIYRGRASTGTSIVEHDNLTIATSFEAVTSD